MDMIVIAIKYILPTLAPLVFVIAATNIASKIIDLINYALTAADRPSERRTTY